MAIDTARVPRGQRAAVKRLTHVSERAFQRQVREAAQSLGWLVHHCRPSRKADGTWATAIEGDAGFPDLCLVHPGRGIVAFLELKARGGKLSEAQQMWLTALRGAIPYHVACFTPEDWPELERLLAGR